VRSRRTRRRSGELIEYGIRAGSHHIFEQRRPTLWYKLERWTLESRAEQSRDNVYEWFQWLADRLQELPEFRTAPPAYAARRDWKP
jgi:hypothetical protein